MPRHPFKKVLLIFGITLSILLSVSVYAYANVYINLVAVNASSDEAKEKTITYYLPKELTPQDVVNTSGLEIDYDLDKSRYFLTGKVMLQPKKSKIFKIEVKDVWRITEEEITILKNQIRESLVKLEGTEYYESAEILSFTMMNKLDYILAQQNNYSNNIERRIEEYRAHVNALNKIKKNAFSLDYFTSEPAIPATDKTVRFIIEVENSSETDTKTIIHRHYLPEEVRSDHVVDSQGFEVRFDEQKNQSYLSKSEKFNPGEKKRYAVEIKDIWQIAPDKIEAFRNKTQNILEEIKGSEFEDSVNYVGDIILAHLGAIEESQKEKQNMRKYIGAYRTNQMRLVNVQDEIIKIERMLARLKPQQLEGLEKGKVGNVLQNLKALRGIAAVSETLFGKKLGMSTTWKVIFAIMAFVGLFTAVHFVSWWQRSKIMGEEIAVKSGGGGKIEKIKTAKNPED